MSRMQTPPTSYSHSPAHALSWGAWPPPGGCASGGPGRLPPPQTVHPSCSHRWSWTPQTGTHASWAWCALILSGKPMGVQDDTGFQSSGYGASRAGPSSQLCHCVTRWHHLPEPQFYLLYIGDYSGNYLTGLLWGFIEIIYIVCLAQSLVYNRYSIKVICYCFCCHFKDSRSVYHQMHFFSLPTWYEALNPRIPFLATFHSCLISISWWHPRLLFTTTLLLKERSWQWEQGMAKQVGGLGLNLKHMTLQSLEQAKRATPWIFEPSWKSRRLESNTPEFGSTTYGLVTMEKQHNLCKCL